jgi:hypothetical protein
LPAIAPVELPVEAEGVAELWPLAEDAEFGGTPFGWVDGVADGPVGALLGADGFGEAPLGDAPLGTDPPGDVPVGETPVVAAPLDCEVDCDVVCD